MGPLSEAFIELSTYFILLMFFILGVFMFMSGCYHWLFRGTKGSRYD